MKSAMESSDRRRLVFLAIGLFVFFALLIAQFFCIQIVQGEKWSRVADSQHFFIVTEPFQRGVFYSNTGIKKGHTPVRQPLVFDIQKFHLYIDPQSIPESLRGEMASRLHGAVNEMPGVTVVDDFAGQFEKKSRSRCLAMWLDMATRQTIDQWWQEWARSHKVARNALFFVSDYQRCHPFGKLLGQVLGGVRDRRDEESGQAIPTGGLELAFNEHLKGSFGKRRLMRSPRHALATGEVIQAPQDGADVYLTINHHLQAIAEEEIQRGVEKAGAKGGWVVMMEPYTGEILALAQYPFFDPSNYQEYYNDPLRAQDTRVRAVSDASEVGSTMKPLTLAIALKANEERRRRGEEPIFDPWEKIETASGKFPGRRDLTDTHKHQYLNMYLALQKSSNIYMARLVERVCNALGDQWYRQQLTSLFGFGQLTGFELSGESAGLVPTPGKRLPDGRMEWSVPTPFSLAIGYNLQANSLQLLAAYATLANGGWRVRPTLIKKIVHKVDDTDEVVWDNAPSERLKSSPRVLDPYIVSEVVTAMKYVMKTGGSARRANVAGYTEAGKTGTVRKIVGGQYSREAHLAFFVGFIPVNRPAFVMLVGIDEPEVKYLPGVGHTEHASICAAPIFKEVARRSLEYLGVAPDDPFGYPPGDPRYDPKQADWHEEVKKMAEVYREWNET